jgi:polynucleotide 5'-kinase involved in rRNA processing
MQFTFITEEWPFRKLNNQVVIVMSGNNEKSVILDRYGDYSTVPNVKLNEAEREFVEKNIDRNELFREICSEEELIEVRYQDSASYLSYVTKHM